jgi:PAS domain S-box-containing protein
VRDLVALATMPAAWVGRETGQVAESVAGVLLRTIRADAVYVFLGTPSNLEAVRDRSHPGFRDKVRRLRSEAAGAAHLLVDTAEDQSWPTTLRVAIHPIGITGDGFVAVGCAASDFPNETHTLLLSVAANQAAVALQTARLFESRRKAEEQLRESHQKTKRMLESITDGFVAFDRAWCITYVNDIGAEFLQRNSEELIGKNLWTEYPDIVGTRFEFQYRAAVEQNTPIHFEEYYPPLEAWFELHLYPSTDGLSIFFRNINERKKAEEVLLRAEKLAITGKLAATVAHEINNPLESVMNLLFLARTGGPNGHRTQYYLEVAEQEITRVAHIARQTLGFYRDSSVPIPLHPADLLEDVLSVYLSRIDARRITVAREFTAGRPIMGMKGELHQVLSNLIANAIDAMESGGQLRLSTEESTTLSGRGVRITIADTGCGIASENLPKIFEPFFTTKKSVGTGLGLWVARQIIESHGGTVEVRSNTAAGEHGTAVSLFLPYASAQQERPQTLSTTARVM